MADTLSNQSTPETTGSGPDKLAQSRNEFIAHWGEMGSSWGVPRSMAEMHALLYIEGHPLCVEEIMSRLEVSRGTASTTLRTLADWGLVSRANSRGHRVLFDPLAGNGVSASCSRQLRLLLASVVGTKGFLLSGCLQSGRVRFRCCRVVRRRARGTEHHERQCYSRRRCDYQ